MLVTIGLLLAQFVPAYLALDLTFRHMSLAPETRDRELRRWRLLFAVACVVASGVGAWAQWRAGGTAGLAIGVAGNWAPWWLLWRFGLRKQLTFLFKDDGGTDRDATKPDL